MDIAFVAVENIKHEEEIEETTSVYVKQENLDPYYNELEEESPFDEATNTSEPPDKEWIEVQYEDPMIIQADTSKNYQEQTDSSSIDDKYDELCTINNLSSEPEEYSSEEEFSDSNIEIQNTDDTSWHNITDSMLDFDLYTDHCTLNPEINNTTIMEPIDIFNWFINDDILDLIANYTNNYVAQQLHKEQRKKSRIKSWTDTNKIEIRKFLGVTLIMGLIQVPSINLYWSKDPAFHNKFISSVMSRDRYLLLLNFLHFSNNKMADTSNRLYKIEAVINLLLINYQKVLNPGRILVINDSIISARISAHNKRHKDDVKIFKLSTSSGYVYNLKTCLGKCDEAQSIVLKLLDPIIPKQGRYIFAGDFYSSVDLTEYLLSQKLLYCGILSRNRSEVPQVFGKRIKKNEIFIKEKNKVRITKWVENTQILMISSYPSHNDTLVSTGKKNKRGEEILKPKCVIDYNNAIKGVDFMNHMNSYHTQKALKWYRKVMFELLLGTSVLNAWIVYNMVANTQLTITEFRRQLADALVAVPKPSTPMNRSTHTFIRPEGAGRKKRKPCRGCYKKLRETMTSREADKKVRRIITYCDDCPDKPGFCLPCFNNGHK